MKQQTFRIWQILFSHPQSAAHSGKEKGMDMKRFGYINILGFILLIVLTACAPEHTPLELGSDNSMKLYQQGKIDPAITAAKKAIAENPDNAGQAWYYLAISYNSKGKKEEARNAYMRVLATESGFFDASADFYHGWASNDLGVISS